MKRRPLFEEASTDTPTDKDTGTPNTNNAGDNSKPEPVATIQVTNLMVSLHNKAIEEAQKINQDFSIFNTMADGDGKKGTFYGGGDHIIMVIPSTEDGFKNPEFKTIAVDMIKTYTQWFCGPDEAEKVKLESVFAHMIEKSEDEKKKEEDEEDEKEEDEDKDLEDTGDDDEEEDKDKDKDKDKPDEGDKPDGGGKPDEGENPSESLVVNNLVHLLFETTQEEDEEIAKEQGMKIDGYYIQYKAEVGDKKSKIDGAWKVLAKLSQKKLGKVLGKVLGLTGGFGIRFFNGGAIRFGDAGKALKNAYRKVKSINKIDKDKTKEKFEQALSTKYPKLNHQVAVKSSKEIQEEYRDRLSKGDYDAIGKSTFCLTVFFDTNSLGYKNITKQKLADMATKSMSASLIDKTLRLHKIKSDDVILLNNIGNKDDQGVEKTRSSSISTSQDKTGETKKRVKVRPKKKIEWMNSSMKYIIPNGLMNMLFEADNEINYNILFEDGDTNDDFGGDGESDSPDNDNVVEKSKVLDDINKLASKLKSSILNIFQSVEENHVRSGVFESEEFVETAKKSDTLSKIINQIDNAKSKYIVATSIRFNAKQLEDKTLLKESLARRVLVSEEYSVIQIGKSDKYQSKVADAMEEVLKKTFGDGTLDHIYRTYVKNKDKKGFSVIYVYSGWNKYNDIEILDDKEEKEGSETNVYDNETGEDLYIIPLGKTLDDKKMKDDEELKDDRKDVTKDDDE